MMIFAVTEKGENMKTYSVTELKNITDIVYHLLVTEPETRNSDLYLYYKVLWIWEKVKGINITNKTLEFALTTGLVQNDFPKYETVTRARRKAQMKHPELRADADIQAVRDYNATVFAEYAVK